MSADLLKEIIEDCHNGRGGIVAQIAFEIEDKAVLEFFSYTDEGLSEASYRFIPKPTASDGFIAVQARIDCEGLYDSITSPVVGSLTDISMQLYFIALREAMRIGPLSELSWIEAKDMLVDSQAKWMGDVLWHSFYRTSYWSPEQATGTRRLDRGTLEKLSYTLLALCQVFIHESFYNYSPMQYNILECLQKVPKEMILFHDLVVRGYPIGGV